MSSSKVLTRLPVAVTLLSMAAMLVLMPPMSSLVAKGFIMRANRASMAAMLGSMGGGGGVVAIVEEVEVVNLPSWLCMLSL